MSGTVLRSTREPSGLLLGRAPEAHFRLDDTLVSSRHALVYALSDDTVEIEDVGSSNGTYVGKQQLKPGVRVRVELGERVDVGGVIVVFDIDANKQLRVISGPALQKPIGDQPTEARRFIVTLDSAPTAPNFLGGILGAAAGWVIGGPVGAGVGWKAGLRLSQDPPPHTMFVPTRVAAREIQLPPNHPVPGSVYAVHPLFSQRYLPLPSFHRSLFQEKHAELLRLLAALGATYMRVRFASATASRYSATMGASFLGSMGGAVTRTQISDLEFEERYPPSGRRHVPDDLVWYHHEPAWKELALRRLQYGLSSFRARLVYADSFGVTASA
jgi:hypothetical protein